MTPLPSALTLSRRALATVAGVGALLVPSLSQAVVAVEPPLDIQLSYTVNTAGNLPAITNLITFNSYADTSTGSWFAASVPAQALSWVIHDPFIKSSFNAPRDALMIGLVQDLPGDAPGQEHVVLMMSAEAAAAARNIAWGTLFRSTLEAELITALHTDTSGLPFEQIQPEIDKLYTFAGGDARSGILGLAQQPIDAWFTLPGVGPGQVASAGFAVIAFSDGQVLGDGSVTVSSLAAVPEPGAAALLAAGLAVLGWLGRRHGPTRRPG